jgi:hypothetical protein
MLTLIKSANRTKIRAKIDKNYLPQIFIGDVVSFSYVNQNPLISRVRHDLVWENVLASYNMDMQRKLTLNSTWHSHLSLLPYPFPFPFVLPKWTISRFSSVCTSSRTKTQNGLLDAKQQWKCSSLLWQFSQTIVHRSLGPRELVQYFAKACPSISMSHTSR